MNNNYTNKPLVKTLGLVRILVIFFTTVIISEFIYIAKHPPSIETSRAIFLKAAEATRQINIPSPTLYLLDVATTYRIKEIARLYPNTRWKTRTVDFILPRDGALLTIYNRMLKTADLSDLPSLPNSSWAKLYYDLGIISFKNKEIHIGEYFLDRATQLAPEWSYFHIELANYYLLAHDKKAAKETIDWCENFKYSKASCQDYFEKNILNDTPVQVGLYENEIHNL